MSRRWQWFKEDLNMSVDLRCSETKPLYSGTLIVVANICCEMKFMYSSSSSLRQFFHSFSVVRLFVAALGLLFTGTLYGYSAVDTLALMPVPASVHQEEGSFSLTARLGVTYPHFHDARLEAGVDRMLSRLQYVTGLPQSRGAKDASGAGALVIDVKSAGQAV